MTISCLYSRCLFSQHERSKCCCIWQLPFLKSYVEADSHCMLQAFRSRMTCEVCLMRPTALLCMQVGVQGCCARSSPSTLHAHKHERTVKFKLQQCCHVFMSIPVCLKPDLSVASMHADRAAVWNVHSAQQELHVPYAVHCPLVFDCSLPDGTTSAA